MFIFIIFINLKHHNVLIWSCHIHNTFCFRIWLNHPEENLGVVVKVQVNKNNKKELEIGQLGTDLVSKLMIWWLTINVSLCRPRTCKSIFMMVHGGEDPKGLPTEFAPKSMTLMWPSAACGLSPLTLMSLAGSGSSSQETMMLTFAPGTAPLVIYFTFSISICHCINLRCCLWVPPYHPHADGLNWSS